MLTGLAKLIAHALFALRRSGTSVLSLIVVTTVATVFATVVAATLLDGRRAPAEVSDASALGTFISANGTTSAEWQIAGASGPGFYDDAGAIEFLPNVSLVGTGDAGLVFGAMTGTTTLPTGALSWTGATGQALTCSAQANSSISTSVGTMSVDGPTVALGNVSAATVNIGGKTSATVNVGDQTASTATGTINLGPSGFGTASNESVNINTGTTGGVFNGNFEVQSSTMVMRQSTTDFIEMGLGHTPNTKVIPGGLTVVNSAGTSTFDGNTLTFARGATVGDPTLTGVLVLNAANLTDLEAAGNVIAQVETTGLFLFAGSGFGPGASSGTIACGTGGTQVVPAGFGFAVTSGVLTSNCVLDFTTNNTGEFLLDMSGVTLGATFGVTFKNGTASKTFLSANVLSDTLAHVYTYGANTLAASY